MRTLLVVAMLCGVCVADDFKDRVTRQSLSQKVQDLGLNYHGKIPVKYHEMFGPYKIFGYQQNGRAITFEARFMKIEKAMVFVAIDGEEMIESKVLQSEVWSIPLKVFDFQGQKALRDEHQKRLKAERDKKVLYPQPPPKKEEPKKVIAGEPKKHQSFKQIYVKDKNGKLVKKNVPADESDEPKKVTPPAKP